MNRDEVSLAHFLPLSDAQARQYIDAETVHREFLLAKQAARQVRGGMLWRKVDGRRYLIRTTIRGRQTSLGPDSPENRATYDRFVARKESAEARLRSLREQLVIMKRLNRAHRVGRVPSIVVDTLNAFDEAGIAGNFLTVGTHAIYAYESAAGLRVTTDYLATQDVDLFFDAGRYLQLIESLRLGSGSLINVLRQADKSFKVREDQKQTAVNDKGFEVDFIRRPPIAHDLNPLPLSGDQDEEDVLWAVQVPSGNSIQTGGKFEQMVVSPTGAMANMVTIDPQAFVRIKRRLSESPLRDRLKARKDGRQADVVTTLLREGYLLPQHAQAV